MASDAQNHRDEVHSFQQDWKGRCLVICINFPSLVPGVHVHVQASNTSGESLLRSSLYSTRGDAWCHGLGPREGAADDELGEGVRPPHSICSTHGRHPEQNIHGAQ